MRSTTEYEVQLYKTRVRPSTRYDHFRKIRQVQVQGTSSNWISTSTTSYEVRDISKVRDRTSTRSYWYEVVLGVLVPTVSSLAIVLDSFHKNTQWWSQKFTDKDENQVCTHIWVDKVKLHFWSFSWGPGDYALKKMVQTRWACTQKMVRTR